LRPRDPFDIAGPRPLAGVVGRPLNFTARVGAPAVLLSRRCSPMSDAAYTLALRSQRCVPMRLAISQRAPLIALSTLALTLTIHVQAQTAPAATAPTTTNSPSRVAPPTELQYSAVGATAQCRDGTFFHGKIDPQKSCAEHGGISKLLHTRGQDLIR